MDALRQSINRLITTSGARLYQCGTVLSDEEYYREFPMGASFAWTVGHIINSQDYFVSRLLGIEREFEEFEDVFRGGRSLTAQDLKSYPTRDHFDTQYRLCHERTLLQLQEFDMNKWDTPIYSKNVGDASYNSHGMMWEFLARHTFYHLGQLSATLPRLAGHITLLHPNLTIPPRR